MSLTVTWRYADGNNPPVNFTIKYIEKGSGNETVWKDSINNDSLIMYEQIRTLEHSTAYEITIEGVNSHPTSFRTVNSALGSTRGEWILA